MGQPLLDSWAFAYPALKKPLHRAMNGEASSVENQQTFVDRNGFLEETYFTFAFSPICDETGIAGIFNPVTETTDLILGLRRNQAVHEIAVPERRAETIEEACLLAAEMLARHASDLPFVLFYLVDENQQRARLVASTGLPQGHSARPPMVDLFAPQSTTWPLADVSSSHRGKHLKDLVSRFGPFSCGEYPESQQQAIILPIILPTALPMVQPLTPSARPGVVGFVVAGVSPRLPLDERYRGFYDALVTTLCNELARLRSYLEPAQGRGEWVDRLEQANLDLESFNYSVSHDLRAPLRSIDGFSKTLLDECDGKLDPQALHYLHRIRAGTQKMSTIIDDLLTLSTVKAQAPRREEINLTSIAQGVLEGLAVLDPARKVDVELEEGLTACADERLVTIVLVNLLGNAWKYTSRQAEPRIHLGRQIMGPETIFFVRDNGVGFDMNAADKLFTPFHRLHKDSEFAGTGIGLATVHRVIVRHGGRIWAKAAVGAGATFYFTLEGRHT